MLTTCGRASHLLHQARRDFESSASICTERPCQYMHRTPLSTALLAGPARCVSGRGDERRTARLRRLGWRRRPRRRRCARARRQRRWEGGSHAQGTSARQPGAGARAGKRTRPLHEGYVRLASYSYVCLRRVRRRVVPQCGNAPCVGGTSAPRFVFRTLPCAHLRPPSALDAHVARIAHLIVIRDAGARDVPTGARGRPNPRAPSWLTGCLPFSARAALLRRRGWGGSSPSPGLGRAS